MTITAAISGQSIGTSTNVGPDKFAYKVTAQTISDRFFIEGRITNGVHDYNPTNRTRIWYASSTFSVTAAASVDLLRQTARYLELRESNLSGVARVTVSLCEPLSGGYVYLWAEVPNHVVAQTLDVNVIEGP